MQTQNNEPYDKKIYWLGSWLSILFIGIACIGFSILLLPYVSDNYNFQNLGVLGDTVGGFLNPIIAIAAALLTFLAFYVQYQVNEQVKKQIHTQQTTDHFYKMLDLHIRNVEAFKIDSYRFESFYNDSFIVFKMYENLSDSLKLNDAVFKIISNKKRNLFRRTVNEPDYTIEKNRVQGRRCFMLMIKDLHYILHITNQINERFKNKLSNKNANELAYKIFFWGSNSNYVHLNTKDARQHKIANEIKERIDAVRISLSRNKGTKIKFWYESENTSVYSSFRFVPFSGHSSRLAHYYRHLCQTVKQLHSNFY